ncbi:sigma-70 family RNA polymerase sigma factor [Microbacterium sp. LWH10-1.2]|uniref:RNA polymerase sigma factor n=1 Tax=Microbacterium sp. LWH10-1.2 TaxID=3135255 RepID=UPI00313861EF
MSARKDGEIARFERAVTENSSALLAYFARRVEPAFDAADLLADTLLTLWRKANVLPKDDGDVRPWMFGIARNVLLHHRRSAARRLALADRLRSQLSAEPAVGFVDSSAFDELRDALRSLEKLDQEIISLLHWDGLSLSEIGRVLKMKDGTVRSRYHRARARLRLQLSDAEQAAAETYADVATGSGDERR